MALAWGWRWGMFFGDYRNTHLLLSPSIVGVWAPAENRPTDNLIIGEKTFVGTVDIKLISAGGRSFNKIVEKGVFEGIKVQK